MSSPSRNSQIENLTSWFAASVIVVAGVIYGLRPQPEPRAAEPQPLLPRATPAQEPLTIQQRRALEKGRGRRAHAPLQIPGRGWRDILVRTYYEIQEDRLLALAAGVSFYSLLSLFPGLAAGVSVYALFADPVMISRHLSVAAGVVPAETLDLLTTEIFPDSRKERWKAHVRLSAGSRHCAVERQCRHEGHLRCAQHHL